MTKITPNTKLYGADAAIESQWNSHNFYIDGAFLKVASTPTSQSTGATGNLTVNCNLTPGIIMLNGKTLNVGAATGVDQADFAVFPVAASFIINGNSAVFHVVAYHDYASQTVKLKGYYGAAAATGVQIPLTDALLDAKAELANNDWFEIGRFVVNRTGDTSVTQTGYDHGYRPFGVRTDV